MEKLPQLIGYENFLQEYINLAGNNRLPHAWIFSGIKGIGKASFALRLAYLHFKGEFAEKGGLFASEPDFTIYNDDLWQRINNHAHPDLLILQEEKNLIKVDLVREANKFLNYTSGTAKILIIDGAEYMNVAAANALLKNLEEPRGRTQIFLISHMLGQLLPTIRSRCSLRAFMPLSDEQMEAAILGLIPEITMPEFHKIRRFADNSAGKFLQIYQNDGVAICDMLLKVLHHPFDYGQMKKLQNLVIDKDNVEKWQIMINILENILHNCQKNAFASGNEVHLLPFEQEISDIMRRKGLEKAFNMAEKMINELKNAEIQYLDKKLVMETALMEIAR